MQIRAENDPRYSRKFLIMGICAVGFALYCLYDGLVGYPARELKGFIQFKTDYAKDFADANHKELSLAQFEESADQDQRLKWEQYAESGDIPTKPKIVTQFIMATVAALAGLALLSIPLRARGRWIEANDSGITSSWGESFQFDEVELVNKRNWRKKGIAKVTYVAGGRRRNFVIDDYKFDRYPTDAILYELEQRIDQGRITNGPPEPPPADHSEEAGAMQVASEDLK